MEAGKGPARPRVHRVLLPTAAGLLALMGVLLLGHSFQHDPWLSMSDEGETVCKVFNSGPHQYKGEWAVRPPIKQPGHYRVQAYTLDEGNTTKAEILDSYHYRYARFHFVTPRLKTVGIPPNARVAICLSRKGEDAESTQRAIGNDVIDEPRYIDPLKPHHPKCAADDRVYEIGRARTLVAVRTVPYWDERGNYHPGKDPNFDTVTYRCGDHTWTVEER